MDVMTRDEFLNRRGAPNILEDHGGLKYPNGISKAERRRIDRRLAEQWDKLKIRDALSNEYDRLVAAGEIRPPTRKERLERTAAGHPDRADVQAARRILGLS